MLINRAAWCGSGGGWPKWAGDSSALHLADAAGRHRAGEPAREAGPARARGGDRGAPASSCWPKPPAGSPTSCRTSCSASRSRAGIAASGRGGSPCASPATTARSTSRPQRPQGRVRRLALGACRRAAGLDRAVQAASLRRRGGGRSERCRRSAEIARRVGRLPRYLPSPPTGETQLRSFEPSAASALSCIDGEGGRET